MPSVRYGYVCMYALFVCIYGQIRERQLSFSDGIGKNEKGENPVFSSPAKMPIKPCLQCIHPQFCDEAAIKQPVSHTEQCRSTSLVTGGPTVTQHPLQVQQQQLLLQQTVSTYLDKS